MKAVSKETGTIEILDACEIAGRVAVLIPDQRQWSLMSDKEDVKFFDNEDNEVFPPQISANAFLNPDSICSVGDAAFNEHVMLWVKEDVEVKTEEPKQRGRKKKNS